jgi:hypothetical protein
MNGFASAIPLRATQARPAVVATPRRANPVERERFLGRVALLIESTDDWTERAHFTLLM